MLNLYDYKGFILVVGPTGKVMVHLDDGKGLPGKLMAQCNYIQTAKDWCDVQVHVVLPQSRVVS